MTTRTRVFLVLAAVLLALLVFLYLAITAILPNGFAQAQRQIYLLVVLSAALALPGTAIGILLDKLLLSQRQEQRTQERFRRLVETSPDAIMLADRNGKWSMVNPQAAALFGAPYGADLIGGQLQDLLSPEDWARAKQDLARVESEGAIQQLRMNLRRMDGTPFPAEISIARFDDGLGPPSLMMVVRDVSDRKQIEAVLYEKIAALQIISEMNEAVTSATTLDARLNILLEHLLLQMDGDLAVIQLTSSGTGSLHLVAQQGARCPDYWQELKTAESAPGWVVQNNQPLFLPDVCDDPRWVTPDTSHDEGIISYYGVPLCIEQRVTGVLSLAMRRSRELLPGDSNFLQSLAGQIAAAIEYARLFQEAQQRASEFAALYETTRDLAYEPDLDTLLRTIVDRAAHLLDARNGAMFLYDPVLSELELAVASEGYPIPLGANLRIGESMAGRVALTRSPLIVDDYRSWPYRSPRYEDIPFTAALQVPMLYGGKLIGVLCVNETEETSRKFTQSDARLLSLFASQAASAVHNARLFHETRIRAEQLALLYDAGLTLNRVLEQHTQLEFLFRIAIKALHADRATFYRYAPEQNHIFAEQGVGYTLEQEQTLRRFKFNVATSEHVVARVARERVPIVLPDIREESTWVPVDPTIRSGAWAPIQHENRLWGVLSVLSTRYNAFSPQDERLLVLFANQVSVAMENAELFEETRHRADQLAVLNRIARAVNGASSLDELLLVIHREITATVPADAFFIALYDAEANQLDYRVRVDEGLFLPPERGTLTEGLSSWVVQTRQPLLIRDWEQEQRDLPLPALWGSMKSPRAWLGVPMKIGEAVVGIINVQSYRANAYTDEDEQLLTTIADQVTVVIEKARLFEAGQTRQGELASLYELSRALADAGDFDSILDLVVRYAVQTLHITLARITLLEGDDFVLRAAYPSQIPGQDIKIGRAERADAHPYCLHVLEQNEPMVLHLGDPQVSPSEQQDLFANNTRDLCLVPLRTGQRALGLLILAQSRDNGEEEFTPERIRLAHSIGDQAASALRRAELYSELGDAYLQSVLSLANAVDAKDTYTANHSERLAQMALTLGRELGMSAHELEDLRYGSLLHDVGKIGVPDAILQKPELLTTAEWEEMRRHPEVGEQIIKPIPRLMGAAGVVRHHHERFDGSGYPDGLSGEAIPLGARILAVADAYGAIVDERVYKQAQSHEDALLELARHIGTQFDPRVVEAFFKIYK